MPWSKIDDNFYNHPKTIRAGAEAVAMFVCGLSYSMRYLTDGFIMAEMVPHLIPLQDPAATASRLVEVGYWHQVEGGYQVHDFLHYNPSAAKIKAERAARAKRQAAWRERNKQGSSADRNVVTNGTTNGVSEPRPIPSPIPSPSPVVQEIAPPAAKPTKSKRPAAIDVFRENAHRFPAKSWYKRIGEAVGEEEPDLKAWGKCVFEWVGRGYNPTNVSGMLDWFNVGIPAKGGKQAAPAPYDKNVEMLKEWANDGQ